MKFQPQGHTTKSNKQITIRLPEVADAQAVLKLKRNYIANTTTLPFILEEYPIDLEKESQLITEYNKSDNSIFLLAEFENKLIGNIDLTGSKRSKMYHTAMLGMGIKENWRNQGLGSILIKSALDWAKHHSEIQIVWLDVYASNKIGYRLYEKTGFTVNGIIKDFFKEGNQYIDKVQMYQRIK